ncbi:MAG: prolyl aminopeptidase [Chitinophagales bacterium]|nr:prolyl aminopeptidase [Chitinophagales bacterium]
MKITKYLKVLTGTLVLASLFGCIERKKSDNEISLWPEIEPFDSGYLKVSDIHEVYYELSGNPEGIPVFVIHGGPGAGSSPNMRRFFNPDKYLIVLHDQRGCGKSKPKMELRDNNTEALIKDVEQLRLHLGLDKIVLFGGSWGSTLSLAYAEAYPVNIEAMVLRGIFLATSEEFTDYYKLLGKFFPEEYHKIMDLLPDSITELADPVLMKLYQSDENNLKVISRMDSKAEGLHVDDKELDEYYASAENMKKLSNMYGVYYHYVTNSCFLESDQLLNGISKIQGIPTTIINGRQDLICPPKYAYVLHKNLPGSKLIITEKAGHAMSEGPTQAELVKAMKELEVVISKTKNQ